MMMSQLGLDVLDQLSEHKMLELKRLYKRVETFSWCMCLVEIDC